MSEDTPLLSDNVSDIVTVENTTLVDNSTLAWAHEWLGYLALGMFSMVLFIPTLGIIGLMLWEYFSDEAERKAERQKEIEKVIKERYLGIKEEKNEEEDSDEDLDGLDGFDGEDFDDNDDNDDDINLDEEAETLLHKRKPKFTKPEDFDTI
ncbi:calsequestrin-2-like [Oppia nitens]|uniref:calsequestrin-2-like n=1 Tax=Oppia nitens TaxID=1686743 RepID=UPI0023DB9E22|nr:calsequestrin-2-like [Oppia nitens]